MYAHMTNHTTLIAGVRKHAYANYSVGGWDYVVEAFDDNDIAEILRSENVSTLEQAIEVIGFHVAILDDRRKDVQAEIF